MLPAGWEDRLIPIDNANTNGVAGLCLEVHDLAISKYVAGRPKDLEFTRELAVYRMTDRATLLVRLGQTKLPSALRTIVKNRIDGSFALRSGRRPKTP